MATPQSGKWKVRSGSRIGTLPATQVQQALLRGDLSPEDEACLEGTNHWVPLHQTQLYREIARQHAAVEKERFSNWIDYGLGLGAILSLQLELPLLVIPFIAAFGLRLLYRKWVRMRRNRARAIPEAPVRGEAQVAEMLFGADASELEHAVGRVIAMLGSGEHRSLTAELRQLATSGGDLARRRRDLEGIVDPADLERVRGEVVDLASRLDDPSQASLRDELEASLRTVEQRRDQMESAVQAVEKLRLRENTLLHEVESLRISVARMLAERASSETLERSVRNLRLRADASTEVETHVQLGRRPGRATE